jgi:hypothetical protein
MLWIFGYIGAFRAAQNTTTVFVGNRIGNPDAGMKPVPYRRVFRGAAAA